MCDKQKNTPVIYSMFNCICRTCRVKFVLRKEVVFQRHGSVRCRDHVDLKQPFKGHIDSTDTIEQRTIERAEGGGEHAEEVYIHKQEHIDEVGECSDNRHTADAPTINTALGTRLQLHCYIWRASRNSYVYRSCISQYPLLRQSNTSVGTS